VDYGIYAKETGNIVISLSTIAEFNYGIYFKSTQYSKEPALITNSSLVGKLKNNTSSLSSYHNYQGILTP
jgi:hypothetical protein